MGDLFLGALLPGLLLVGAYILYLIYKAIFQPDTVPAIPKEERDAMDNMFKRVLSALLPPVLLVGLVLGSILAGWATPTEAASVGAVGAMVLAMLRRCFTLQILKEVMRTTTQVSSMVFIILVGASIFSLVFRGYGGDDLVREFLSDLPGGVFGAVLLVMLVIFLLGFFLDFIEITFVVVPIVAPILLAMGLDPIWLG